MKITRNFFKNIPVEKRVAVKERLQEFATLIQTVTTYADMPNSFWIRKVTGTEIYKFRVNSGDRILFEYDDNNEVCFLSFETHDDQIRVAQTKQIYVFEDFVLNTQEYIEDDLDDYIDYHAKYELEGKLEELRQNIIVDNEDITLIIEDPLFKDDNYLTVEQFEILNKHKDISIVLGCAGSGKTSIGIRKLLINQDMKRSSTYLTHSKFLNKEIKKEFLNISDTQKDAHFYSLQDFYETLLEQKFNVVYYPEFIDWLKQNNFTNSEVNITPLNIFLEINTVLKGSDFKHKMMARKNYLDLDSHFNNQEQKYIYHVASHYDKWLNDSEYYDLNDLAKMTTNIDTIETDFIVDEVQDFTQVQLHSILNLKRKDHNIMLFGDNFQSIQNYTFSLEQLKKNLTSHQFKFHITYLSNNFRSGDKIVNLLNKIKQKKETYQVSSAYLEETSIRKSPKPEILFSEEDFQILGKNLNKNADAILVVSNHKDKQKLLKKGFNRIFYIHDLPGLQYSNVYCYNLFNHFNTVFKILNDQDHSAQLNSILFNFIYLSSSRALNKLVFIEHQDSNLSKSFKDYIKIANLDKLIADESTVSTIDEWNKDGYYLKRLGKYKQAIKSFELANNIEEVNICKKLNARKLNYEHLAEYELVIKFDWLVKSVDEIENALLYLKNEYDWEIRGNIRHYVSQVDGSIFPRYYFIHDDEKIYELSNKIAQNTNHGAADKRNIFFAGCIYSEDTPIKINPEHNSINQDLYITYTNNKYNIVYTEAKAEHAVVKVLDQKYEKLWSKSDAYQLFNREAHLENTPSKKTAEDHLSDIFN